MELSRNSFLAGGVGVLVGLAVGHLLFGRHRCPLKPRSMYGVEWRRKEGRIGESMPPELELAVAEGVSTPRVTAVDEVLVRVTAVSIGDEQVDPASPEVREGRGVGRDLVGLVEEVGTAVDHLSAGDRVWSARSLAQPGCMCEYVVLKASDAFACPLGVEDTGAAAIAFSGLCVLRCLKDSRLRLALSTSSRQQRVLLLDAASGYGTVALQILQSRGIPVSACMPRRALPLARMLGVDPDSVVAADSLEELESALISHTVPYGAALVAGSSLGASAADLLDFCRRFVSPRGPVECIYPVHAPRPSSILFRSPPPPLGSILDLKCLEELREMVEMGQLVPVLDRTFSVSEMGAAVDHLCQMRSRVGTTVIKLDRVSSPQTL